MELGLIDNAVLIGVVDTFSAPSGLDSITSWSGTKHSIKILSNLKAELANQGKLSDYFKKNQYNKIWEILGWEIKPKNGFGFAPIADLILLDFDLDCFCVHWEEFIFPWPDEVYENYFNEPSVTARTEGWTGKNFLGNLIERASCITIAMEPDHCGGDVKSNKILKDVNRFLFNNQLK